MMLVGIAVQGFKRIRTVELELAGLNILVGANSSGKSSIVQAVHLACSVMHQARDFRAKPSTIDIDQLDYLPSDEYKKLAYNGSWGNTQGTLSSLVKLTFDNAGAESVATCRMRSARNAGISASGTVPPELTRTLRARDEFFSSYIPGISGIPNKEEKKSEKVVLRACSYGDSNVFLRNVLHLLKERNPANIAQIESWIGEVAEPMTIDVRHLEKRDLTISCDVKVGNLVRPLELIGTGYLQLIHIFAYILLFNSKIVLIDEPDIHLPPTLQEKLVRVLSRVAQEREVRILLTSHSPFIVRGAPLDANIYWLSDGKVESTDRCAVELALGWGAFGKKLILVSEDGNLTLLKKIISQWPNLEKSVAYFPGTGYRNLTTPKQAAEISASLGGSFKVVVHRDRDSLTAAEVATLKQAYSEVGVTLWLTALSDIEAYFCEPAVLASILGCPEADAQQHVEAALTKRSTEIDDKFKAHREAHNRELYSTGGSPTNGDVLAEFSATPLRGARGKTVFAELKTMPGQAFAEAKIVGHGFAGVEVAPDLRTVLEQVLA